MRLTLNIDHLAMDATGDPQIDAGKLQAAVERELSRMLGSGREQTFTAASFKSVPVAPTRTDTRTDETLARSIATHVYEAMKR